MKEVADALSYIVIFFLGLCLSVSEPLLTDQHIGSALSVFGRYKRHLHIYGFYFSKQKYIENCNDIKYISLSFQPHFREYISGLDEVNIY